MFAGPWNSMAFLMPWSLAPGEDGDARRVGDASPWASWIADAVVVDLVDDGVVGGPAQVAGHLLGGGQQAVPDDLDGDRDAGRLGDRHVSPLAALTVPTVMTSSPWRPTLSWSPACITVVAVCSEMTAGPAIRRRPAGSRGVQTDVRHARAVGLGRRRGAHELDRVPPRRGSVGQRRLVDQADGAQPHGGDLDRVGHGVAVLPLVQLREGLLDATDPATSGLAGRPGTVTVCSWPA